MDDHGGFGQRASHVSGRLGCDSEAKRDIVHVKHHHALVLRGVLSYTAEVTFDDMVAVQKGLLAWLPKPDFVFAVLGK